eukprot:scaffold3618_cov129-Cylindrotheca_fusiformis.AAC.4
MARKIVLFRVAMGCKDMCCKLQIVALLNKKYPVRDSGAMLLPEVWRCEEFVMRHCPAQTSRGNRFHARRQVAIHKEKKVIRRKKFPKS